MRYLHGRGERQPCSMGRRSYGAFCSLFSSSIFFLHRIPSIVPICLLRRPTLSLAVSIAPHPPTHPLHLLQRGRHALLARARGTSALFDGKEIVWCLLLSFFFFYFFFASDPLHRPHLPPSPPHAIPRRLRPRVRRPTRTRPRCRRRLGWTYQVPAALPQLSSMRVYQRTRTLCGSSPRMRRKWQPITESRTGLVPARAASPSHLRARWVRGHAFLSCAPLPSPSSPFPPSALLPRTRTHTDPLARAGPRRGVVPTHTPLGPAFDLIASSPTPPPSLHQAWKIWGVVSVGERGHGHEVRVTAPPRHPLLIHSLTPTHRFGERERRRPGRR
ncbi:hypothetical protein C8F04DRAFT_152802 [Mycena alexandri]|uniref:Uncharacterized protein n=1 Tax=Mycena alexandri TaxID=1745969 RepID=A0AAD6SDJ4_9AGAR|nr:hypothetical protein C8F04DRAFT_152802 [Mycena alexandri]